VDVVEKAKDSRPTLRSGRDDLVLDKANGRFHVVVRRRCRVVGRARRGAAKDALRSLLRWISPARSDVSLRTTFVVRSQHETAR